DNIRSLGIRCSHVRGVVCGENPFRHASETVGRNQSSERGARPAIGRSITVAVSEQSTYMLQASKDLGFRLRPNDPVNFPALFKHEPRRDPLDIESPPTHGFLTNIKLRHTEAPRHFRSDLIDHRSNHFAGSAPFRPHIDHYR